MAGLKEVRIRIASVKSTQQITSAMKMVAASKLRKAQNSIIKLRPYAAKLRELLQNLSASIGDSGESIYSEQRTPEKILVIVISSNRGLCGAFNSNIMKATLALIREKYQAQFDYGNVNLITIGKRATEYFTKRNFQVIGHHDEFFDNLTFANISPFAEYLMQSFVKKEFDRIEIVYNQFKNAAVQKLVNEQFLPVVQDVIPGQTMKNQVSADYIFEPDKETVVRELIPKTLRIQVFKAVLDSFAAEMGARMTAMQQATDNARELLKNLNITYNKARQNQITNELIEIVSGAEALKG
ncbi:MAG: ATP synthase F1 subunit gamma [Bacteroidetes bacterium]|nr:ATP synthase F1 subunit gamma [Bacteroidota bacterium]